MTDIETDFDTVYSEGEVVNEREYHQPEGRTGPRACKCDNTTEKGAYRDVSVEYDGLEYHFYHQTPVVVKIGESTCRLDKGGWDTKSTKDRLNHVSPNWITVKGALDDLRVIIDGEEQDFHSGMIVEK